ncbi:hypothetical protein [Dyella choica]|uniref:Transferrin-binding protein B C-lobe/N-lobe beta barrel domain-containing protein n=1 Tax=Dyella choica TaxID=1927959 RepID=A0A3S0PPL8_9GAMM|nr:hypothetical protein [Dyella choica]RUL78812.1 hypothetical protein EKH80_03100 [Dyella choica]
MTKVSRFIAMCTIGAAVAVPSFAWAQTYTTVSYPGAVLTELVGGPNPQGTSVGGYTLTAGGALHGFTLKGGEFTSFDPPGSTFTTANFINPLGVIVGAYVDVAGVSHGFILRNGTYTTFDYPGAAGTELSSINPAGELSGATCSDAACGVTGNTNVTHSFLLSKGGVFSATFDPPGATSSTASVVIPSGAVIGAYTHLSGTTCFTQCQGYLRFNGSFATINYPGSSFTFAGGANAQGEVVGIYTDASGVSHGFLFNGAYTSFDYPGATFTEATGINPSGVIVGVYVNSAGVVNGFIRKP